MNTQHLKTSQESKSKLPVIYIAGATRSGSTIISNILGQIDGFFHAGEVIEAWDRGRVWNCSCGLLPSKCPVWSSVFRKLDGAVGDARRKRLIHLKEKHARSHHVILPRSPLSKKREISGLTSDLVLLYQSIQAVTGAEVVIDSSKNVGYGHLLSLMSPIDLYIVHLVRDPRAVVFSWSVRKKGLWTEHPFKIAATWTSRNIAAELIKRRPNMSGKYIKVHYENFIADPVGTIRQIVSPFNVSSEKLPFLSSDQVRLTTSHGLCGNPNRFGRGVVRLKMDRRWKNLKTRHKILATALTWPLLYKYRYTI